MSRVEDRKLRAAIKRGDVQAVDRALQSGVSPDAEIAVADNEGKRSSLLYLAAEVCLLECQIFSCVCR